MNEQDRSELERIMQRQARLELELTQLSAVIKRLEENARALPAVETVKPLPAAEPLAIPPIIPRSPVVVRNAPPISVPIAAVEPHPSPAPKPAPAPVPMAQSLPEPEPVAASIPLPPPVPASAARTPAPATKGSFEMRLGTYWLVRIGIVLVLTSLVFFGNLAYQNVIRNLGPGWKISLLYAASGLLLGAGAWWQRKAVKESLKNYAQVLFAGGLAAVYFTTYAAHHVERLRVIESAGVDGALLLAWAGFMVWMADRKKSEVLAFFAVGLAYYTSIITRVGSFTLYSNVVLTAAAVFFLVRNRWAALSAASLVATYASYAFWRFFDGEAWRFPTADEGLWSGIYFLICYWVLFTAAVFLSRDQKFAGRNRAAFLTLNNGAFFTWFILTMFQVRLGGFWKFALIYGGVLLALAALARIILKDEPLAKNAYLTQGLVLVTVGIIVKYSGMQLALMLAAESVVLLMAGQYQRNLVLKVGSFISALLAVGWGMDAMWQPGGPSIWLGVGLGVLMMVNTLLAHHDTKERSETGLRGRVTYFTVLALAIWYAVTWNNSARENFPLTLAVEALLLTASFYVLRVREIPLLGQSYLVIAQFAWVLTTMGRQAEGVWWKPALLIAISVALSHWWQKQKVLSTRSQAALVFQAIYALAIVGVFYGWLIPQCSLPVQLAVTSLLAVGITAYGVFTRAWVLAACGQISMAFSCVQFVMQLASAKPPWFLTLVPIATLAFFSLATVAWFRRDTPGRAQAGPPLLQLALAYRWMALAMSLWWVCEYIPERERIWVFGLLGVITFALAGISRNRETLLFSAAFSGAAIVLFWGSFLEAHVYVPDLLVIIALLAQAQIARRLFERYEVTTQAHGVVVVIGGLCLWLFLCRWILQNQWASYLTASWSLLALVLFVAGILLHERVYRWLGLGILACTLGRVVLIDVWGLEAIYRVLSFLALGIVLLVLGFLYNKYQEKLKEWL